MIVLSLDTCLGACSAAIIDGDLVLGALSEPMVRGHQERLASMIRDLASDAKIEFAAIDRIGVTIGPGSFTGLRVGLAFAKGLGVALDRPCIGVGVLQALAATACVQGRIASVIDAGRANIYLQTFDSGAPESAPGVIPLASAADQLARGGEASELTIVGPAAGAVAALVRPSRWIDVAAPSPEAVARLASRSEVAPAAPLYLRPPDAVARR